MTNKNYDIALVKSNQHESLIDLLCELHEYYHEANTTSRLTVKEHLLKNLLASDSPHQLVVATHPERGVVGLAAISLQYSLIDPTPENQRQCHLKELFVRSTDRSHGVGHELMAWVAQYAIDQGCCRIDWHVQVKNHEGVVFYRSLGAEQVIEKLVYRLSGNKMADLAKRVF
jgi:GNAT superfamily N-acetyltransferase